MRSNKNRLTHSSMLTGWISVLVCRCGCNSYKISSTKRRIINGTFTKNCRNRFNARYRRLMNSSNKIITSRFIGQNTDTTRNKFTGRQRC